MLTLDIEGSVRVSDMLDRLAASGLSAQLGWRERDDDSRTFELVICAGTVRMRFVGDLDDTASGSPPVGLLLPEAMLAALYDGAAALDAIEWTAAAGQEPLRWLDAAAYRSGAEASEPSQVLFWNPTGHRQHPPMSLIDFVATGQLGPIGLTVTRQDIGRDFGVPTSLGAHSDYWGYGALSLAFAPDGALEWLQIDAVRSFSGACEIIPTGGFAGPLILMLDGLSGASRPSDLVRLLLVRGCACRVAILVDWNAASGPAFDTAVMAGPVISRFFDAREAASQPDADDPRALAAAVEARVRFDAILAYAPIHAPEAIARWIAKSIEISGEDYLHLLGMAPPRVFH